MIYDAASRRRLARLSVRRQQQLCTPLLSPPLINGRSAVCRFTIVQPRSDISGVVNTKFVSIIYK